MSKVETILSQLKDIAANPKKAMDDFKAETGKGAVGVMPIYAPEEMIHATGFLPMGLCSAVSARFRLLHHAADHGTAVRRRIR